MIENWRLENNSDVEESDLDDEEVVVVDIDTEIETENNVDVSKNKTNHFSMESRLNSMASTKTNNIKPSIFNGLQYSRTRNKNVSGKNILANSLAFRAKWNSVRNTENANSQCIALDNTTLNNIPSSVQMKRVLHRSKRFKSRPSADSQNLHKENAQLHLMRKKKENNESYSEFVSVINKLRESGIDIPENSESEENFNSLISKNYDPILDIVGNHEEYLQKDINDLNERISAHIKKEKRNSSAFVSENQIEHEHCANQPSLFDIFLIIGPDITDILVDKYSSTDKDRLTPKICYIYPPEINCSAESIEQFCFPDGIPVAGGNSPKHRSFYQSRSRKNVKVIKDHEDDSNCKFFVFLISGGGSDGQDIQYASCMYKWITIPCYLTNSAPLQVQICYCFITQAPYLTLFQRILKRLLDAQSHDIENGDGIGISNFVSELHKHYIKIVLSKFSRVPKIKKGDTLSIRMFPEQSTPLVYTPLLDTSLDSDSQYSLLILRWSLPIVLSNLSINHILDAIGCLLVEMRIIVVCEDVNVLTATVLSLTSLLKPLTWVGPLIAILPTFLHDLIEAPVPFVIGVTNLPESFEILPGTAILMPNKNEIHYHCTDIAACQTLKIPNSEKIYCDFNNLFENYTQCISTYSDQRTLSYAIDLIVRQFHSQLIWIIETARSLEHGDNELHKLLNKEHETFINRVINSQMYQSFSDKKFPKEIQVDCKSSHQDTVIGSDFGSKRGNSVILEPIHDLFQIAITGVCERPHVLSNVSTKETALDKLRVLVGHHTSKDNIIQIDKTNEGDNTFVSKTHLVRNVSTTFGTLPSKKSLTKGKPSLSDKKQSPKLGGCVDPGESHGINRQRPSTRISHRKSDSSPALSFHSDTDDLRNDRSRDYSLMSDNNCSKLSAAIKIQSFWRKYRACSESCTQIQSHPECTDDKNPEDFMSLKGLMEGFKLVKIKSIDASINGTLSCNYDQRVICWTPDVTGKSFPTEIICKFSSISKITQGDVPMKKRMKDVFSLSGRQSPTKEGSQYRFNVIALVDMDNNCHNFQTKNNRESYLLKHCLDYIKKTFCPEQTNEAKQLYFNKSARRSSCSSFNNREKIELNLFKEAFRIGFLVDSKKKNTEKVICCDHDCKKIFFRAVNEDLKQKKKWFVSQTDCVLVANIQSILEGRQSSSFLRSISRDRSSIRSNELCLSIVVSKQRSLVFCTQSLSDYYTLLNGIRLTIKYR